MPDQAPTQTIVETVTNVFPANEHGYVDIKLANGWKLSTKKPAIAEQARRFEGNTAAIDYFEKVNGQWTNRYPVAFRQAAAEEVDTTGTFVLGNGGSSQDEFRRSKEEMRWTEALGIAATLAPTVNADTYAKFKTLALNVYSVIEDGPQKPEEDIPF